MSSELRRLELLELHRILHSDQEQFYDDITKLASRLCDCPISLISFVAQDYQWFKSSVGLLSKQTPRESSFCSHAIKSPDVMMIVEDAKADKRFADNELVIGEPHIRFYAGYPLRVEENVALGTLCVIDTEPRIPSDSELENLESLGRIVTKFLQIRKQVIDLNNLPNTNHETRINMINIISDDLLKMLGASEDRLIKRYT